MNYGWLSDQGKEIRDQGSWIRDQRSRITTDNWYFLLSRLFYANDVVPFVVTYNPALPRISNILRRHFTLRSSNRYKDVFKQPPFVAYRRSPNLCALLVKAQLPVISNTHFSPRSFRCGQNCATCPNITNGLTSHTFHSICTGETHFITSYITCNARNLIYMVQCNRCNFQCIGET